MEHIVWRKTEIPFSLQPRLHHEHPLHSAERSPKQEVNKPDTEILESMMEHEIMSFHQKSKNDVMVIYDLSQEVYYRHNDKNPELAKLAASLFLFFSDLGYYLNMENKCLIPVVRDLIEKTKHTKISNHPAGQLMPELKHKIQREQYSVIDKLKYFRMLTGDYRIPEGACKSYKLLFDKLKKLENDLVMYIHFENDRFFPLAIEMENYLSENKLCYEKK